MEAASGLSTIVTTDMMSGVLDEIVALLPVVIPVMIGFIGLRKGISFLQGVLHSACSQPLFYCPKKNSHLLSGCFTLWGDICRIRFLVSG